jgi:hypothetical protein
VRHHVVQLARDTCPFLGHGFLGVAVIALQRRRSLRGFVGE